MLVSAQRRQWFTSGIVLARAPVSPVVDRPEDRQEAVQMTGKIARKVDGALGVDVIALMDALQLNRAVLAGYD